MPAFDHDGFGRGEGLGFSLGALARGRFRAALGLFAHADLREDPFLGLGAGSRGRVADSLLFLAAFRLLHRGTFGRPALGGRLRGAQVRLEEGFGLGMQRSLGLGAFLRALQRARFFFGAALRRFG